jgi:hypothetical protein
VRTYASAQKRTLYWLRLLQVVNTRLGKGFDHSRTFFPSAGKTINHFRMAIGSYGRSNLVRAGLLVCPQRAQITTTRGRTILACCDNWNFQRALTDNTGICVRDVLLIGARQPRPASYHYRRFSLIGELMYRSIWSVLPWSDVQSRPRGGCVTATFGSTGNPFRQTAIQAA